jgi:gliding motility-associated-like protein
MQKVFIYFLLLTSKTTIVAQFVNNSTSLNNKVFINCGLNCNNIEFSLPNIKTTSDYLFKNIQFNPYSFTTSNGLEDNFVYQGFGTSSGVKNLPFSFCFYDSIFQHFIFSATGLISFDTTNKGPLCGIQHQNALAIPNNCCDASQCSGNAYYPKASIFTVQYDFDPRFGLGRPSAPDRKIEYRIEGIAPFRRFILSFYKIGTWGSYLDPNCWPNNQSTFQTVLYESTNIIEMYVKQFICNPFYASGGKAIMGLQNWERNKAVWPPGKNAQPWTAVNQAFQYIPSGGASNFVNSKLYTIDGTLLKTALVTTNTDGSLGISFTNVCNSALQDTVKYVIKSTYNNCTNSSNYSFTDTILYVNNAVRTINDTVICLGNNLVLQTNNQATSYNWQPAIGLNNATLNSPIATPLINTTYIVTATKDTCVTKDTVIIKVYPKPIFSIPNNFQINIGGNINLPIQVQNYTSLLWTPSTFLNNTTQPNPTANNVTNSITYKIIASNNGCVITDSLALVVIPNCGAIKEAFTPNGDGINDLWQVYDNRICFKQISVSVYNRYGSLVFKSNNYYNNWNGSYNDKPLPDGTYYYNIVFTNSNGNTYIKKGDITILR